MKAMDHIDIAAGDGFERPRLMLSILEIALLVGRERHAETGCDGSARGGASFKYE
jgi:hypothetical protein